ncbi:MAG: site-specific integrase [Candidatus Tenebribacter davisii]|nr:site-specific integrase [Candidatus Tenebribacter davisii]
MEKKKNNNIAFNRRIFNSYLKSRERGGFSLKTIDKSEQAITHLEKYLNGTSLKKIKAETFNGFRAYLDKQTYRGEPISSNTKVNIISQIHKLFEYLSEQKGYKRIIEKDVLNCWRLSPSEKQSMKNIGRKVKSYPKLKDIEKIINDIPTERIIDRRDRALIAYLTLTASRIYAAVTMTIGRFDPEQREVYQDPNMGVKTKNSKYIPTTIPRYFNKFYIIFTEWIQELKSLGFEDCDPMFPIAKSNKDGEMLEFSKSNCLLKDKIAMITGEKIVKERCRNSGYERYHAHSFRDSHIYYGLKAARNGLEVKVVGLNVGHESINTTLKQYADLSPLEVHDTILKMGKVTGGSIPKELEEKFKDFLRVFDIDLFNKYYSEN